MEEPAMINSSAVDQRETVTLIGSDKVEGTPVYRPNGESVGTIQRVMIDKIGGHVAYAVMIRGGAGATPWWAWWRGGGPAAPRPDGPARPGGRARRRGCVPGCDGFAP